MGLNDNIHTISKSIISEKQERIEARERKDFLKECQNELKALLLNMLIEEKKGRYKHIFRYLQRLSNQRRINKIYKQSKKQIFN